MWPFAPSKQLVDGGDANILSSSEVSRLTPVSVPVTPTSSDLTGESSSPQAYQRLGFDPVGRILLVGGVTGFAGIVRGFKEGAHVAVLCYRAENAHLTPTSKAGWYLYNKSKNYHGVVGGVRKGLKMGGSYFGWSTLFLTLEGGLDAARGRLFASRREAEEGEMRKGQADVFNTVSAAVAVAVMYSWRHGMDRFATSRVTKGAFRIAVPYGLAQDGLAWLRDERVWYADGILRLIGGQEKNTIS